MRVTSWIHVLAVSVAMVLPHTLRAADNNRPATASPIVDVALGDRGQLDGQLVDRQGRPVRDAQVGLLQQAEVVAVATTDDHGRFQMQGVAAGVYQLASHDSQIQCRLWAPQTAPPSAARGIQLVDGQTQIMRGQMNLDQYGPALRGAVAGGLITGLTYWALDYNDEGS